MNCTFKQKRIVVAVSSNASYQFFIETAAFDGLINDYKIELLTHNNIAIPNHKYDIHSVEYPNHIKRSLRREFLMNCSMKVFAERSETFPYKTNQLMSSIRFVKKMLYYLLFISAFYRAAVFLENLFSKSNNHIVKLIEKVHPEIVIVISGFNDVFAGDVVKSCKKCNTKSFLMMFNWDNVSCKGVLTHTPDFACVWGEQTAEQMEKIHLLPRENIFPIGAPRFDIYSRTYLDTSEIETRKKSLGFSSNDDIILFAGVARHRDEISLLKSIDKAITHNELPSNVKILYRPHPWQDLVLRKNSFFDYHFNNVKMDPQLEDHYIKSRTSTDYNASSFVPKYSYYPQLLAAMSGVISSMSTLGIEAMIMGKPVLLLTFPDPVFSFSFDTIKKYEHHKCWNRFKGAIDCYEQSNLLQSIKHLIDINNKPESSNIIKQEVKYVAYNDKIVFSERLKNVIDKVLS